MLDVARISVKGQVTIPVDVRRKLGLKDGDKVVFMEREGSIILQNANRLAFEEFQREMEGAAEEAGWAFDLINNRFDRRRRNNVWLRIIKNRVERYDCIYPAQNPCLALYYSQPNTLLPWL